MSREAPIYKGQIITGHLFNEPMRVETVSTSHNSDSWEVGLVGMQTGKFHKVLLSTNQIKDITITEPNLSYDGDGRLLKLGLDAHAFGIAHEFDPYFGLSLSRVDPLPHQLEAVYEHLLKLPTVRFLLADDAGAGKTIMAGLLVRELNLRGLVERILVVCPANLTFQWQRELSEKFDEKFIVMKGGDIREQFGINQWMEHKRIITSLDLAKRSEILAGLQQVHWDLVIIDEAHRMSWSPPASKTARYELGELLRDTADHILLLTATPHKGNAQNFTRFLQLLDRDAYADVKSIHEAMKSHKAPFYLRRTKEAMVYFPKCESNGEWRTQPVFTKRISHTADFTIDNAELDLYKDVTRFVKYQSAKAEANNKDPRARAVGFLMALYQRRLASSTYAMRRSLERRAKRLEDKLKNAQIVKQSVPPSTLPSQEEVEEMEDAKRECLEDIYNAITLANKADQVRDEIEKLKELASKARAVEDSGNEAKITHLEKIMREKNFFNRPDQRLLLFTEFRDTLEHLMTQLKNWGFSVGCIHGGMKPGSCDEQGTRIYTEKQFREGIIQVLVATEAAGEGINLQCCHILFNYDIPWNPNRLEQRMGRIHRYGQQHDCLIFNFVATNTIEGRVLDRLMAKIQEIRNALNDDAVFNVVGEVLPSTQIERVLRDYYSGKIGDNDLEERILKDVDEIRFRAICRTALEGLATKNLNLDMIAKNQSRSQENRIVPENIARFMKECAKNASLKLRPVKGLAYTFDPGQIPPDIKKYDREANWKMPQLKNQYPRLSTDRKTVEKEHLEWITPRHPLFEALRRHSLESAEGTFARGACFYSLTHESPTRFDIYRARVVNGLGHTINERLFTVELSEKGDYHLRELRFLGDLIPADPPDNLPTVASLPEVKDWLIENALISFLEEIRSQYLPEVKRIAKHVKLSLTEVLHRTDQEIGRANEDFNKGIVGAKGRLTQAEVRHYEVQTRRKQREDEFDKECALSLQGIDKLASALILPHPERDTPDVRRLRPNPETEMVAMQVVMDHEIARGCKVDDVHEENLGYDVRSHDLRSGELRLIEVKGLAATTGDILLTPNEYRTAEDRRDCYWLYVVTGCASSPTLREPIKDPARFQWDEFSKVQHYQLKVDTITMPVSYEQKGWSRGDDK